MKLNPLRLIALSNLKGMKRISSYEVVAGGVIINYNKDSIIAKTIDELDREITRLMQNKEER